MYDLLDSHSMWSRLSNNDCFTLMSLYSIVETMRLDVFSSSNPDTEDLADSWRAAGL